MEKEKTYRIELTFEELQLLDGKVREEAQKVINQAKMEQSIGFDLPIMNEILRKSLETGTLTWSRKSIRSCSYCDKKFSYHTYARNSRYHNKGDKNYDKPLYYGGIAFNEGFIVMQGVGDMCWECCDKHQVIEKLIDYIWENDLKVQVQSNNHKPGKYLKDPIYSCGDCNSEFLESTMGREPAVFSGTYPSRCPNCESKNTSRKHDEFSFELNPRGFSEVLEIEQSVKDHNSGTGEEKEGLEFYQSQRNKYLFIVEKRYSNRIDVLRFDTKKKKYALKGLNPDLEAEWGNMLDGKGYTPKDDYQRPIRKQGAKR